jgi:uncharacterized protein (DUF488 family)
MENVTVFTIGFTQKTAKQFFETLRDARVQRLIDVRLNNQSQLSGFAKLKDLQYFTRTILGIPCAHEPLLAPTAEILSEYRAKSIDWATYERRFLEVLRERKVESCFTREFFDRSCLLCSEPTADQCHRRLIIEYLQNTVGGIEVQHLG